MCFLKDNAIKMQENYTSKVIFSHFVYVCMCVYIYIYTYIYIYIYIYTHTHTHLKLVFPVVYSYIFYVICIIYALYQLDAKQTVVWNSVCYFSSEYE
jgi:hypothetical protein